MSRFIVSSLHKSDPLNICNLILTSVLLACDTSHTVHIRDVFERSESTKCIWYHLCCPLGDLYTMYLICTPQMLSQ
ncbi:hypothetical protein AQUCO_00200447v1 [Aquilegia coerulea]|uniref:Uncharacterized protein n=1 Tax=Aquilegia coerulea TaxID=218851 RepID=A0A2G5F376_AQUCA|nr:hypothetical protein AQUCO_00200447v1 [Aquilegia coerulea]